MRLRLVPVVLFAASALLGLKFLDGGWRHELSAVSTARAAGGPPARAPAAASPAAPAATAAPPAAPAPPPDQPLPSPPSAEAVLNQRLAERRRELDDRNRTLDERENLLRAAERRLEERLEEMRRIEQRVDQAAQARQEGQNQQMRGLVTMYENMRPADAAKIFNTLDTTVLMEVVTRMNPRKMGEILAAMQAEAAQRLTVEMARRAGAVTAAPAAAQATGNRPSAGGRELQRIDGRRPG